MLLDISTSCPTQSSYVPPPETQAQAGTGRLRFTAVRSFFKRICSSTARDKAPPFVLVRADNESRTRRARKLQQRLTGTADHLRTTLTLAPGSSAARRAVQQDMTTLYRTAQSLQELTGEPVPTAPLMRKSAVCSYLATASRKSAGRYVENLARMNSAPIMAHMRGLDGSPQLREFAATALNDMCTSAHQERTVQAFAPQLESLCAGYAGGNSPPLSSELLASLMHMSNAMKMLRPTGNTREHLRSPGGAKPAESSHAAGVTPAHFLGPAMQAVVATARKTPNGITKSTVLNMLKDLSTLGNPQGLRTMLHDSKAVDIWLASQPHPPSREAHAACRAAVLQDLDTLLDGVAGAAQLVVREQLMAATPNWARDARAGLFKEASTLYQSAARWHQHKLALLHPDPVLRQDPAETVGMLVEQSIQRVLSQTRPVSSVLDPLLRELDVVTVRMLGPITLALEDWRVHEYAPPEGVQALRGELLRSTVMETGVWREVKRLAAKPRLPDAATVPADLAHAAKRNKNFVYRPVLEAISKKAIRRAGNVIDRDVGSLLRACQDKNPSAAQAQLKRSLPALLQSRRDVDYHGKRTGQTWQNMVAALAARRQDSALLDLNNGALQAHIMDEVDLLAQVTDPELKARGQEMVVDLWNAVRIATAGPELGKVLQSLCRSLGGAAPRPDGATLFGQIDALRGMVNVFSTRAVGMESVLSSGMQVLSDREFSDLVTQLANAGARDGHPNLRQSLKQYLDHAGRSTKVGEELLYGTAGLPPPPDPAAVRWAHTEKFLDYLFLVAQKEVGRRLATMRRSLTPGFREAIFKQVDGLFSLIDTPDARRVNGNPADVVEELILEEARLGLLQSERGEDIAEVLNRPRFLRTARGYDVASELTQGLRACFAALNEQIRTGISAVGLPSYRSSVTVRERQAALVDEVLQAVGIWGRLDNAGPRLPFVDSALRSVAGLHRAETVPQGEIAALPSESAPDASDVYAYIPSGPYEEPVKKRDTTPQRPASLPPPPPANLRIGVLANGKGAPSVRSLTSDEGYNSYTPGTLSRASVTSASTAVTSGPLASRPPSGLHTTAPHRPLSGMSAVTAARQPLYDMPPARPADAPVYEVPPAAAARSSLYEVPPAGYVRA